MNNNKLRIKHKCVSCISETCLIAKYYTPTWKAIIDQNKTIIKYKRAEHVFHQNDQVYGIYFICSGKAKVFKKGYAGKTKIVRLAKGGNILGHRGYGGNDIYPVSASTLDYSEISFIESDVFIESLKINPELSYRLMLFYAEELKSSESQLLYLSYMSSEEKVAEALLRINKIFGVSIVDKIFLDVTISRQEIADIVGLSAGQVVRTLSGFRSKNIISTQANKIYITNYDELVKITTRYREQTYE